LPSEYWWLSSLFFHQNFLSLSNWLNTSVYTTTTLLLALGETVVIITGGIDLSVGRDSRRVLVR